MVYQRVSKFSPRNSQIHKKDSASTVPQIPVQAKSDSALPQEQEMPIYTPLAADWVTNNNLMKNLSGAGLVQRQEKSNQEKIELIQAKLTIGEVADKYEQEADKIAQQVVSQINAPASFQSSPGQSLQRDEIPEDEELQMKPVSGILQREEMPEDEELQMKPMMVQRKSNGGGMAATPELEVSIQQAKGGGQPIANSIREPMEKAFGADFSGVNVHTDAQSDQMNQSIQAKAFTTGQDIFFRQGAYDPRSQGGQELIAHELTHVVQQNGGALQPNRIQRFEFNPFVTKRSLTEDLSYYDVKITEEEASPLEKIGISADMFMVHYRQAVSSEDLAQIAEFALKKFPKGGQAAFEVAKYLFKAKLLLGSVQKFTDENLTLLYALWNKLKIEATQELVNLVVSCAEDNPLRGVLYALLKEGIALNTISIELLNHLKPFSEKILSDSQALLRAYTVATEHPEDLVKLEEWSFDRDNYEAAQSHAEAAKQKHLQEGMTKIEQSEKTKQDKAIQDKLEEAKEQLVPNDNKRKKAFPAQPPTFGLEEYNKMQGKLKEKQEELAAEDFVKFGQERQVEKSKLSSEAEQLSTQDQEKYKRYLATINYHKEAPKVLKFALDNFDDATKIVLAIQQVPGIINIINGSQLSPGALISCINILGVVNLGTLLGKISYPSLKAFADKQERLTLLRQMQTDNINLGKIQGMESQFGTFDQYCDPGSIPHFSKLLQNYTIEDIKKLLSASQKAAQTDKRMAFLARIVQYASSANDMVKFLILAKTVSEKCASYPQLAGLWKAAAIELALNNQPLSMNEKELKNLIVSDVLTRINKENHFSVWIDILNILMQENLATINKSTGNDWYWLPGGNTKAIEYEVKAKDDGAVLADFVAHWHPGAVSADTKNPNASKKHLKPIHGDTQTQRVYENSVPKPLAENLLWGTH